jgi:hypothetical protein
MSAARDEVLATELARALERTELTLFVKRGGGGNPQPQIAIHCPRGFPEARARAAVFAIAALASIATPLDERWVVRGDPGTRRVILDLPTNAHGREIERALRVLRRVIS